MPDLDADPVAPSETSAPAPQGPLHEQVFRRLSADLMAGRFAAGQKLPLRALAVEMGTSLMPVRDAVQRLESLGALVSTPGRTMMVPQLSSEERADLIRLRMLLETETVHAAAERRSEEDLADLSEDNAAMRIAAERGDTTAFLAANLRFHRGLAAAARIHFLEALLDPLWMRLGPVVRELTPDRANMLRTTDYHDQILRALLRRDGAAAQAALSADVMDGVQAITAGALPQG
ncbi:GntR family transcriptional regulator [Sedimentimonas flavescens]|uniref:GntR family transcriptional regulator n=1 Tax=Sedimentimonas flavescens TaxID=2851012 RepID=UPI001C4A53EA|nr:GntR family transcriptional regulator [Sedimentimonas flavescens]MBW0156604.1 GntR family transcriptional regulator [Sedimentimonas flavescens]MCT2539098.1 GntR family transcriptional regulator [Sedimentimonas flavescens]